MQRPSISLRSLLLAVVLAWFAGALPAIVFKAPVGVGELGDMFGAVNALFSGLAFAGVVYAIFLQQIALDAQRDDTKKATGAARRQLHIELQRMAIEDPDLQEVWGYTDLPTHTLRKQHAYINLVLSHWENDFATGLMTEEKLRVNVGRYIGQPLFYQFWTRNRDYRRSSALTDPESRAIRFHDLVDRLYLAVEKKGA